MHLLTERVRDVTGAQASYSESCVECGSVRVQDDPQPNDVEYYYDGKQDPALRSRVDEDYGENYEIEARKAEANQTAELPFGTYMPDLRDYTLKDEFRDPFRAMPQVSRTTAYLVVSPLLWKYCMSQLVSREHRSCDLKTTWLQAYIGHSSYWYSHDRTTGRHVPYGITQWYMLPDTSERTPY